MSQNSIQQFTAGPFLVKGDIQIISGDDNIPHDETWLCRCGASKNKPYCDGSHKAINFNATGELGEMRNQTDGSEKGGVLEINPSKNGPLLVKGAFSISNHDGSTTYHGKRAALCRCGASKNMPFCDGSHKEIGFTTE